MPNTMIEKLFYIDKEHVLRYADSLLSFGTVEVDVDGFYYWYPPDSNGGHFSTHMLRQMCDYIDELNEPWQRQIDEYFANQPPKIPDNDDDIPF